MASETIADIAADLREWADNHAAIGPSALRDIADRIEAARACEVQSLQGTIVKLNNALAEKQELSANSKSAQIEFGNVAAIRKALVRCADIINKFSLAEIVETPMEVICDIEGIINAALAAPARECDRFDDDMQADGLHEAFVKYCNDCDCPMGCIHRMEMKGLLDVRCASILTCFARFALSEATPKEGGEM